MLLPLGALAIAALLAPRSAATRYYEQLTLLLDLLDYRFRTRETLELLGTQLIAQLRALGPAARPCKALLDALDFRSAALGLPSVPKYATTTGTIEKVREFVTRVVRDVCERGQALPGDVATLIREAVGEVCASGRFKRAYP